MKRVYITALTNERYIPGVMALARSLYEVRSEYSLAVMIPAEKEDSLGEAIRAYGILDIPGTFLLAKENIRLAEMDTVVEAKYSYWRETFFKLQAVGCTEYEKIILLDSDMLINRNIDHLFEKSAFSAAICGKCVHDNWTNFNSGLFVLEPSQEFYDKLISLIIPAINLKAAQNLQAGDQDVFHLALPEWRTETDLCIPDTYNIAWGWIADLCKKEKCKPDEIYVIHFTGKEKPWDYGRQYYIRIFLALLRHGKTDKLIYKTKVWKKYRDLCEKV